MPVIAWSASYIMWFFFLPLEPPACLPLEPEKKRKGKEKEEKKKINWAEEKFSRDLCHGFFVFWHLQLAPGCQLTLRNRCCPSVCHRLLFLSLLSRVCLFLCVCDCVLLSCLVMRVWIRVFRQSLLIVFPFIVSVSMGFCVCCAWYLKCT